MVFKRLNKADITTVSYTANKQWSVTYTSSISSSIYLNTYKGIKVTESFNSGSDDINNNQYNRLIYDNINHMFYQSYVDNLNTSSLMFNINTYESASQQRPTSSYFNYNTNPQLIKQLPSSSGDEIRVISINQEIYGSKILPYSFRISSSLYNIYDDGNGNLYNSGSFVGNIFYAHGISVITDPSIQTIITTGSLDISFQNEHIVYENEIKCIIKESEFNLTYNPSLTSGSYESSSLYGFATSASFYPYVTTIGLYNDDNELLVVAKLGKPIMVSPHTDQTIIVKYDI
jgi:hypothetical protein